MATSEKPSRWLPSLPFGATPTLFVLNLVILVCGIDLANALINMLASRGLVSSTAAESLAVFAGIAGVTLFMYRCRATSTAAALSKQHRRRCKDGADDPPTLAAAASLSPKSAGGAAAAPPLQQRRPAQEAAAGASPRCGGGAAAAASAAGKSAGGGRGEDTLRPRAGPGGSEARTKRSEPSALITAVHRGRFWELPELLDSAIARIEQTASVYDAAWQEQILSAVLSVLRTCSVERRHHEALSAFDHVVSRLGERGVSLDDLSSRELWSVLLYNAVGSGAFDRCAHFYKCLRRDIVPSQHDFVNIVQALAHRRDLEGLEALTKDLAGVNCRYNAVTRTRVLTACCSEGAFEFADKFLGDDFFSEPLNETNFNTVMRGYGRKGHLQRCFELRDRMVAVGLKPSQMTYGILLDACVHAADYPSAKAVFDDFRATGLEPNAVHYTTLIKALLSAGKLAEVDEVLETMVRSSTAKPDFITYQSVMRAFADRGDVAAALRTLQNAVASGIEPDAMMFECVLTSCCVHQTGHKKVLTIFDALVEMGMTPTTSIWSTVVKALSLSKSWAVALELLLGVQERFGGSPAEAHLFAQLGLACLRSGDYPMALKVNESMLKVFGMRGASANASSSLFKDCMQLPQAEAAALAFGRFCDAPGRGGVASGAAGSRGSSSTRRLPPSVSPRLEQFAELNGIDDRCCRLLLQIEPGRADWVMDQEYLVQIDHSRGTASAKVVAAVQRSKHQDIDWDHYPGPADLRKRLSAFVSLNSLRPSCEEELARLPDERLRCLMDQDFLLAPSSGGRPPAPAGDGGAEARLMKAVQRLDGLMRGHGFGAKLREFILLNRIDDRCANALMSLPRADAAWVMDQEFKISVDASRGTASAKVVGLITRLRSERAR